VLTRAEAIAASCVATVAWTVLAAYVPYHAGWYVSPMAVLAVAVVAGAGSAVSLCRDASHDGLGVVTFLTIVGGIGGALIAIASPSLLPVGGGPDLTHHLVLINYIERTWRLVHDPALYPYLGDMMDYTPGSHLLIALAGRWTGTDGLHAAHTVLALSVALKAGVVFLIARRVLAEHAARTPWAAIAPLLLFFPFQYVVGSFAIHSYWAQVVAELFAVAAWWALLAWDDEPRSRTMALVALFGAATFVTWPIWIGPLTLTAAVIVWWRDGVPLARKARDLTTALAPIAAIAIVHSAGKLGRLQMAATSGFVIRPSPAVFGTGFLIVALAGLAWMARDRRGRAVLVFLGAIALQSLALFAVASAGRADTPYMALKMMYLTPYPLAIGAAIAVAFASSGWSAARAGERRGIGSVRLAWPAVALVVLVAGFRFAATPRPAPIVTATTLAAGQWAREHVDRACVDYLVADGYTGYWLHLAVLDNPRDTPRFNRPETFEPAKAIERWVDTDGLPYAIVEDVDAFSKALFVGTDVLADFGPSRVIKRRGNAICR
jgi:hypothetical protein